MKRRRTLLFFATLLVVFGLATSPAQATLTYTLNTVFNGASPTSSAPWLTATFDDHGSSGSVTLTLTSSLEVASEFIGEVAFNLNPNLIPSSLIGVYDSVNSTGPAATSVGVGVNTENLLGGGAAGFGFDFQGSFPLPGNAPRFYGTDIVIYTITGVGLTEEDFAYTNTGSAAAHVAAHIQGIPLVTGGTTSGAIKDGNPVPIPAAVWLFGTGLLGLFGVRRKIVK